MAGNSWTFSIQIATFFLLSFGMFDSFRKNSPPLDVHYIIYVLVFRLPRAFEVDSPLNCCRVFVSRQSKLSEKRVEFHILYEEPLPF